MLNTRRIKIQPKKNSITFRDKYLNNGTGLNFQQKRKKESIFSKFNNFLNKLSFSQYLILVVLICGISIFAFDQVPFLFNSKNGNETHAEDLNNDSCNNIFDPSCWTGSFFPELKQKDHLTNALLVGLDTRNSNSGLMNTDTILLASYDHETGKTLLISFPRDLYVPYIYNGKGPFMTKINSIYAIGENSGEDGLKLLKSNIEEWFDIEIHYSAKVYFNTVVDLVDKMGGIDIDVEKDYVDIYPYDELSETRKQDCQIPENYPSYCLFKFEEGINHLSGEEALIYARMRQYTSDFDRARRQQQVIDAIKTKGISKEGSLVDKAQFGWDIYQTLQNENNVESNIEYKDMLAGLFLLDKADLDPIKIVLDPSIAGGSLLTETSIPISEESTGLISGSDSSENTDTSIINEDNLITDTIATETETQTNETGEVSEISEESKEEITPEPQVPTMYVILLPNNSFDKIKEYIEKIRIAPDIFAEKASILISNASGKSISSFSEIVDMKESGALWGKLNSIDAEKRVEDYRYTIFVFNNKKGKTVEYIKNFLGSNSKTYQVDSTSIEKQSTYKEDIKIVIAEEFVSN